MSKIYLGGSCSSDQRTLMQKIAKALRDNDLDIYCPFELKIPNAWDYSQEDWAQLVFAKDLEALNDAEIFLMVTPGRFSSAGTNWEQGYAYAKGKKVVVVQFTDAHTSLMTYAGSTVFINTTLDNIVKDIMIALKKNGKSGSCKTTLT